MKDFNEELAVVKKRNTPAEKITKEELARRLNELKKCREDITYFANTYFRVISPDVNNGRGGLGVIKLFPKQEELMKFFKEYNRCIVTASRQSGKSTAYNVFCLWRICFFPNTSIMLLAQEAKTAISLLGRIRMAYEYLPSFLKPSVTTYNKSSVEFTNHSTIQAFATASQGARGSTANLLIVDECAFVPNSIADDFMASVYPVISRDKNSKVIFVSTPNGMSDKNLFYHTWKIAGESSPQDKNAWQRFRMDWWDVPGRDETWKENQIKSIGIDRFRQEFGNEFMSSGGSRLLSGNIITELRMKKFKTPEVTIEIESMNTEHVWNVNVWRRPKPGHVYVAGGDIAEGIGSDKSALLIFDITDMSNVELALSFSDNHISISEYVALAARLLNCYNCPPYLAEDNGVGAGALSLFNDHYHYSDIVSYDGNGPGIHSTSKNKMAACMWAKELLSLDEIKFILGDELLLSELENMTRSNNKTNPSYSAPRGEHDDLSMAFIWGMMILNPDVLKKYVTVLDVQTMKLGTKIATKFLGDARIKNVQGFEEDKLRVELERGTETQLHLHWWNPALGDQDFQTSTSQSLPAFVVNYVGDGPEFMFDEDQSNMW